MNSKPSDPQQRRPEGRMYYVENVEQSGSDDWQIANVVDWRRPMPVPMRYTSQLMAQDVAVLG